LGTPIGGTKEILSAFDPQFLFSDVSPEAIAQGIQAAIRDFFSNAEQYHQLRLRCRKYAAANYSWQRHINRLKELIEEIR
jgi:glycosyltransferase involved in cell wall biosynthesis